MSRYKLLDYVPREDVEKLILFLKYHWKEDHVFVKSRALLDFQHYNKEIDGYTFIVAENQETREYDALEGYIPSYLYDASLKSQGDYWSALWKRREDKDPKELGFIGIQVHMRQMKLPNFHSLGSVNPSDFAKKVHKGLNAVMEDMLQYYILNDSFKEFKIAGNVNIIKSDISSDNTYSLEFKDNNDWDHLNLEGYYHPLKTLEFFKNRYANHPIYKYSFINVYHYKELVAIFATRIIHVNNSSCIRIVDVLGKLPEANIKRQLLDVLYDLNAEYIDILNWGISKTIFFKMGFDILDVNGSLIIPNYFEPFEQRNVVFKMVYNGVYNEYVVFKGDADYDRPNVLP